MSETMEVANGFVKMCSEEITRSMPRHTNAAIRSDMELPESYVELSTDDIEYTTGEGFSSKKEYGRYSYSNGNYGDGWIYLMGEAGYHGALVVSSTGGSIAAIVMGVSMPIAGAAQASLL